MPHDQAVARFADSSPRAGSLGSLAAGDGGYAGPASCRILQDEGPRQGGPQPAAAQGQNGPDRSSAYYHYGLAQLYEEMAVNAGRPDYATQAVEEYKLALDADPNSVLLQDGLADLYLKLGRIQDAISTAKDQVKRNPNDVDGAHPAGAGVCAHAERYAGRAIERRCCSRQSRSTRPFRG